MNRLEKLRRRIAHSPKHVRFEDLVRRPHVLPTYVRLALKAIERVESEDEDEQDK